MEASVQGNQGVRRDHHSQGARETALSRARPKAWSAAARRPGGIKGDDPFVLDERGGGLGQPKFTPPKRGGVLISSHLIRLLISITILRQH